MAWGRKHGGGRKEPRFGLAAAMADLRLDPKDRIPVADDKAPKKAMPKRKPVIDEDEDDAPPPRETKPRQPKKAKPARRTQNNHTNEHKTKWALVCGIWGVIA